MIKAFHINSTAPFFASNQQDLYKQDDFDLFCSVLSALAWQRAGGSISMITDKTGLEFYKSQNLCTIWDGGVLPILEEVPSIDNIAFWAAGKLFALQTQNAPCVMMDTDFIAWEIPEFEEGITVAHREPVNPSVYPDKSAFKMNENYIFPKDALWSELPCNTAFAYFDNDDFKNYYTSSAFDFMKNANHCDNVLTYMVFAEQRLLAMCAAEKGVKINSLLDYSKLEASKKYTHLWGYKQILRENENERTAFCSRCALRIESDFSEYVTTLKKSETLGIYF